MIVTPNCVTPAGESTFLLWIWTYSTNFLLVHLCAVSWPRVEAVVTLRT
jgi:hypothetical protein